MLYILKTENIFIWILSHLTNGIMELKVEIDKCAV